MDISIYKDGLAERRNFVVLSFLIIVYYFAGFSDDKLITEIIKLTPKNIIALKIVFLVVYIWYWFRYWQVFDVKSKKIIHNDLKVFIENQHSDSFCNKLFTELSNIVSDGKITSWNIAIPDFDVIPTKSKSNHNSVYFENREIIEYLTQFINEDKNKYGINVEYVLKFEKVARLQEKIISNHIIKLLKHNNTFAIYYGPYLLGIICYSLVIISLFTDPNSQYVYYLIDSLFVSCLLCLIWFFMKRYEMFSHRYSLVRYIELTKKYI